MDEIEVGAILSCLRLFEQPIQALEWGSGNSTVYFASRLLRCSKWVAIEHNSEWASRVLAMLAEANLDGVELHSVQNNQPFRDGTDGDYNSFRDYILYPTRLDQRFHVILVDGRARVECMRIGWMLLDEGGIMILHDAQRIEYRQGIPPDCFYVRLTNPTVHCEGPISVLFMSKSPVSIRRFSDALRADLPGYIVLESNPLAHERSRCLFINTYYPAFMRAHYNQYPQILSTSYDEQKRSLLDQFFGDSEFYSSGLRLAGWDADDLIVNCAPLQQAWTRENDFRCSVINLEIAVEQIRRVRPQAVYLQDLSLATEVFLSAIRPYTDIIAGQIASPVPTQALLSGLDLVFSSFPHFVDRFRASGSTAYYQPLAFEPRVLEKTALADRCYPATFVGGITAAQHGKGTQFLERLTELTPVELWGYGADTLRTDSPIRRRHHGEVWGLDMFSILRRSFITINRHADVAENNANNMRLFEATGCGALLITDYKDNLHELFEIGKEVVVYRSPEECAALIRYYLDNSDEAAAIAKAGQTRTLTCHTYANRMLHTAEILDRHHRYARESGIYPAVDISRVSYGVRPIDSSSVTQELTTAWKDEGLPARQRALVQQELICMYRGGTVIPFQALADALRPIAFPGCRILEIGCSSGYYYEALEYLLKKRIKYVGVDYSEPMTTMAKNYYSGVDFVVADGATLPFRSEEFYIAISSCILLHVPNYRDHIAETTRIATDYVIAHRTPICRVGPTQFLKKFAYDIETVELLFSENELLAEFSKHGFTLLDSLQLHADQQKDQYNYTYIFKKVRR